MKKRSFIEGISQDSLRKMIPCFNPQLRNYQNGEIILRYSESAPQLGVLLEGNAKLTYIDINGDSSLLERYESGDLFGPVFSLPLNEYEYIITAEKECKIVYLDYNHCITPCENACSHHSTLINNLFMLTAQKSQELSFHISILNQHNTRKKLLAYLNFERLLNKKGYGEEFQIPWSLSDLAEYLSVDRTAMMKELKQMKSEGLIWSERRNFKINPHKL